MWICHTVVVDQTRIADPSFTAADLRGSARTVRAAEIAHRQAISAARTEGWSWARIGKILGLPGETVRRQAAAATHPVPSD